MTPTTSPFDDASSGSTATTGTSETRSTQTFQVVGMTCDHCARAVTSELMTLGGVTTVSVDVPTGQITVGSTQPLPTDELRAAIDEAGYQLA